MSYPVNQNQNAAQAFSNFYASNGLGQLANHNRVSINTSSPGLPSDSFRRTNTYTSKRFYQPVSQAKKFMSDIGSLLKSVGSISQIVSFFYPPAAAISSVTSLAAPAITGMAGDTTPKPVVFSSTTKYNPWVR